MNNTAYVFAQNPIWEFSYDTGTFGDYDMDAVRRSGWPFAARRTLALAGQAGKGPIH